MNEHNKQAIGSSSSTQACVKCGALSNRSNSLAIDKQTWCGSCAYARIKEGYRIGEKRIPWVLVVALAFPVVFLARLVVGWIANEGPGNPVNPVAWGIIAAFVGIVAFGFLRKFCLRRWWIQPSATKEKVAVDWDKAVTAISAKLKTSWTHTDAYGLPEVKGMNFSEIDVLIRKGRMTK